MRFEKKLYFLKKKAKKFDPSKKNKIKEKFLSIRAN